MSDALVSMKEAEDFVQSKLRTVMEDSFREGMAEGRRLERARIAAIFSHPACKGREHMAYQLVYGTDFSVEDAISQLEASLPPAVQQPN